DRRDQVHEVGGRHRALADCAPPLDLDREGALAGDGEQLEAPPSQAGRTLEPTSQVAQRGGRILLPGHSRGGGRLLQRNGRHGTSQAAQRGGRILLPGHFRGGGRLVQRNGRHGWTVAGGRDLATSSVSQRGHVGGGIVRNNRAH